MKKLEADPLHLNFEGTLFVVNPQDALLVLFPSLYDRRAIGHIPLYIQALEDGETEPLVNALKSLKSLYTMINWPMNYSVMTYEELPFFDALAMAESNDQSEIAHHLTHFSDLQMDFMQSWHSFRASALENQPVVSDIPTLLASGGLDHVTPPHNAKVAIKHLENSYELLLPDEGHSLYNPCFYQIVEEFYNDPFQKPDMDCAAVRNPIEWKLANADQ